MESRKLNLGGILDVKRFILCAFLSFALLGTGGCRTKVLTDPIIGPDHQIANVFRKEAMLPASVRRVAVLPINVPDRSTAMVSGKQTLEPLLQSELTKAGRFETIFVSAAQLKGWMGRDDLDAYDPLPPQLFKVVAEKTGADAVLFCTLAEYKAYPPMVIGWRMKLAANDADILWAVEEVFDASEHAVSNSARRYDRAHVRNNPVLEDSRSILLSPRRFGQYTLDALFGTLPTP